MDPHLDFITFEWRAYEINPQECGKFPKVEGERVPADRKENDPWVGIHRCNVLIQLQDEARLKHMNRVKFRSRTFPSLHLNNCWASLPAITDVACQCRACMSGCRPISSVCHCQLIDHTSSEFLVLLPSFVRLRDFRRTLFVDFFSSFG